MEAQKYADKIDAFLEKYEILLLQKMIMNSIDSISFIDSETDNKDIKEWIAFVWRFIVKEEEENHGEI